MASHCNARFEFLLWLSCVEWQYNAWLENFLIIKFKEPKVWYQNISFYKLKSRILSFINPITHKNEKLMRYKNRVRLNIHIELLLILCTKIYKSITFWYIHKFSSVCCWQTTRTILIHERSRMIHERSPTVYGIYFTWLIVVITVCQ